MDFQALQEAVGISGTNGKGALIYKSYEFQAGSCGKVRADPFLDMNTPLGLA